MLSVVERILRILRFNFEARLSGWEAKAEERRRGGRGGDAGERRRPPPPPPPPPRPDVDPELARYYANLEVPYGADLETVRDSWKRLVRKYHPDLHGKDLERQQVATELVKGLNHAFGQLEKRLGKAN